MKAEEITVGDVPRLLAELVNGQKRIEKRLGRLETDVATLKTDVHAIRKHLNVDEEIENLATVGG